MNPNQHETDVPPADADGKTIAMAVSGDPWRRARAVQAMEEAVRIARRRGEPPVVRLVDAAEADPIFTRQCARIAAEAGAAHIVIDGAAGSSVVAAVAAFVPHGVTVAAEGGIPGATDGLAVLSA